MSEPEPEELEPEPEELERPPSPPLIDTPPDEAVRVAVVGSTNSTTTTTDSKDEGSGTTWPPEIHDDPEASTLAPDGTYIHCSVCNKDLKLRHPYKLYNWDCHKECRTHIAKRLGVALKDLPPIGDFDGKNAIELLEEAATAAKHKKGDKSAKGAKGGTKGGGSATAGSSDGAQQKQQSAKKWTKGRKRKKGRSSSCRVAATMDDATRAKFHAGIVGYVHAIAVRTSTAGRRREDVKEDVSALDVGDMTESTDIDDGDVEVNSTFKQEDSGNADREDVSNTNTDQEVGVDANADKAFQEDSANANADKVLPEDSANANTDKVLPVDSANANPAEGTSEEGGDHVERVLAAMKGLPPKAASIVVAAALRLASGQDGDHTDQQDDKASESSKVANNFLEETSANAGMTELEKRFAFAANVDSVLNDEDDAASTTDDDYDDDGSSSPKKGGKRSRLGPDAKSKLSQVRYKARMEKKKFKGRIERLEKRVQKIKTEHKSMKDDIKARDKAAKEEKRIKREAEREAKRAAKSAAKAAHGDNPTWEQRYEELRHFQQGFGHANVPARYRHNKGLATWVANQRRNLYRNLKDGKKHVTPEMSDRIAKLDALGFEWFAQKHETKPWEERFRELLEFKTVHGHCRVPKNYANNPALAEFVKTQRRMFKEGNKIIQGERTARLLEAGFEFVVAPSVRSWDERYKQLVEFRRMNGHCRVPPVDRTTGEEPMTGDNPDDERAFRRWAHRQRSEYAKFLEGKRCWLDSARIKKLEAIGFQLGRQAP